MSGNSNPLISAPHVPQRQTPQWGQFLDGAAEPLQSFQGRTHGSDWQASVTKRNNKWSQPKAPLHGGHGISSGSSTPAGSNKARLVPAWTQKQSQPQPQQVQESNIQQQQHKVPPQQQHQQEPQWQGPTAAVPPPSQQAGASIPAAAVSSQQVGSQAVLSQATPTSGLDSFFAAWDAAEAAAVLPPQGQPASNEQWGADAPRPSGETLPWQHRQQQQQQLAGHARKDPRSDHTLQDQRQWQQQHQGHQQQPRLQQQMQQMQQQPRQQMQQQQPQQKQQPQQAHHMQLSAPLSWTKGGLVGCAGDDADEPDVQLPDSLLSWDQSGSSYLAPAPAAGDAGAGAPSTRHRLGLAAGNVSSRGGRGDSHTGDFTAATPLPVRQQHQQHHPPQPHGLLDGRCQQPSGTHQPGRPLQQLGLPQQQQAQQQQGQGQPEQWGSAQEQYSCEGNHWSGHLHQQEQGQQPQRLRQLPTQQQQGHYPPQQVSGKRGGSGAAAPNSAWSANIKLASLTRVPAAATAAGLGSSAGVSDAGHIGQRATKQPLAGGAGGGGVAAAKPASSSKKAVKGKGKAGADSAAGNTAGKAAGRGKATASSSRGISMELTPAAPGEAQQQPKLHQSTLFDTLKRAQRNKQQAGVANEPQQQQHQQQQQQQQGGEAQPSLVSDSFDDDQAAGAAHAAADRQGSGSSKPTAGRKRRSSTAAAAGSGGGRAGKAKAGKGAAAALEGAVEKLDSWNVHSSSQLGNDLASNTTAAALAAAAGARAAVAGLQAQHHLLDITSPASPAWQQLQEQLVVAEGVALGLLISRTVKAQGPGAAPLAVQHYSSLQQLTKPQLQLLGKAALAAKKQAAAAAVAAAAATDQISSVEEGGEAAGSQQVVGLAVMPLTQLTSHLVLTPCSSAAGDASSAGPPTYFMRVGAGPALLATSYSAQLDEQRQQQLRLPPHAVQLLNAVLQAPSSRPCVCCAAKSVLCSLSGLGYTLPPAARVSIIDPELLGWLLDSQLVQDSKRDDCYALDQQLGRARLQVCWSAAAGPIQRLHGQLWQSLQLASSLHGQLASGGGGGDGVAGQAIKLEMKVCPVLAKMEAAGVGCNPSVLAAHRAALAGRLAAISARAAQLTGRAFNLSSSSQLATVLYQDLGLTPPAGGGGRRAAKTHLPTNEAALKQLAAYHELPGLVLEHRCIVNVMSKWIDAPWVQRAAQACTDAADAADAAAGSMGGTRRLAVTATTAAAAAGGGDGGGGGGVYVSRVHCCWQQTSTATGRLSSCSPNLQAVTKYTITAQQEGSAADDAGAAAASAAASPGAVGPVLTINVRDAFVAPAGKLLLSADYSQIELRLLAHFSDDPSLRQILQQESGDVFNMIAAALQQAGSGAQPPSMHRQAVGGGRAQPALQVSPAERERAKRVVYGIVYGLTPYGLSLHLADQAVSTAAAQGLIDSFLSTFPGVRQFMARSLSAAQASGAVRTLMGRRRPIAGLLGGDAHERAAAGRKVVNSEIQGSAADLIKLAMCAWDDWCDQQQQQQQPSDVLRTSTVAPGPPGARLIAQIHDELLFEVDAPEAQAGPAGGNSEVQHPGRSFLQVAAAVRHIMETAAPLAVPLRVKLAWGRSWGSLQDLQL